MPQAAPAAYPQDLQVKRTQTSAGFPYMQERGSHFAKRAGRQQGQAPEGRGPQFPGLERTPNVSGVVHRVAVFGVTANKIRKVGSSVTVSL